MHLFACSFSCSALAGHRHLLPIRLLVALVIVAVGSAIGAAADQPSAAPSGPAGPLFCADPDVDFGEVEAGEAFEHVYAVENRSDHPITIIRMGATCDCAAPRLFSYGGELQLSKTDQGATHLVLQPGDKARVLAKIDSTGQQGNLRRRILIFTDQPEQKSLPLTFGFTVKASATSPQGSSGPAPRIVFDLYEVDFGEILAGEKKRHTFVMRNDGEGPLHVKQIKTSCGCTVPRLVAGDIEITPSQLDAGIKTLTLEPGEQANLEVEFNSTGRSGKIHKKINVYSDDPENPGVALVIKGQCQRAFELVPSSFYFSYPIMKRHSVTRSLSFRPTQMPDCRITDVSSPAPYIKVKWLDATMRDTDGNPVGETTFKIEVTIDKDAPLGAIAQAITVKTNHKRIPQFQIPVRARISPEVSFTGPNPRNPENFEFGVVTLDEPQSQDMEILNQNPEVPYVIDDIAIDSKEAEHLETHLITLDEGVKYILRLTVKPGLQARFFKGTLRLTSSHPDLALKEIPFQGWIKTSPASPQEAGAPGASGRGG